MNDLQWYIKTPDGTLIGPFASSGEANQVKITEGHQGSVEKLNQDGKQLLNG